MKHLLKYFYLILLLTACKVNPSESHINDDSSKNYIKLIMRNSSGCCTHLIKLNKLGNGVFIAGQENIDKTSIYLYKEKAFYINNPNDLNSIKNIIKVLRDSSLIETKRPKGAMHYELFINNEKKINAYARKSEVVNDLVDIISKYYPIEFDFTCEKYVE